MRQQRLRFSLHQLKIPSPKKHGKMGMVLWSYRTSHHSQMAMGMSLIECTEVQCYRDKCFHHFEGLELMQQSMWQEDLIDFARLLMHVLTRRTLP